MSGNPNAGPPSGGGPPDGAGPPEHAGPPEDVEKKIGGVHRDSDGDIVVSDDPLNELANNVDWQNLSPFEEYVLAVLNRRGLL